MQDLEIDLITAISLLWH